MSDQEGDIQNQSVEHDDEREPTDVVDEHDQESQDDEDTDKENKDGVKRKRGRPRKGTKTNDLTNKAGNTQTKKAADDTPLAEGNKKSNDAAQLELTKAREEMSRLLKTNQQLMKQMEITERETATLTNELESTQCLLQEKERDYSDLLHEISNSEGATSGASSKMKPKGLVIYDNITKDIAQHLTSKIDWKGDLKSTEDLVDSANLSECANYDVTLIITGAGEILDGSSAVDVFDNVAKLNLSLAEKTKLHVTSIPPSSRNSLQVNLLNVKFGKLKDDNSDTVVINVKPPGLRMDQVHKDGFSLKETTVNYFAEKINESLVIPEVIKTENVRESSSSKKEFTDYHVTAVMKVRKEKIGKIIGKGGNIIKKLTDENRVEMSFGKWSEYRKEHREEYHDLFFAVMITGQASKVKVVQDKCRSLLSSDASEDEPQRKKSRY